MLGNIQPKKLTLMRTLCTLATSISIVLSAHFAHAQEKALTLGLIPHMAATDMAKRYAPLAAYLSQSIGVPIHLKFYKHFEGLLTNIGEGEVDIAFLGPAPYIQVTHRYGPLPILARTEINGRDHFRGVVFVRKDSPVTTLSELKDALFASVSRFSTMDLLANAMLVEAGVPINGLPPEQAMGSHQNVALGVLTGDFDAGCVQEDVFVRYEKRGLRKLAFTPSVPEHIFVASNQMPTAQIQMLQQAFLALNGNDAGHFIMTEINPNMTAMLPTTDSSYDELRSLLSTLEKRSAHD